MSVIFHLVVDSEWQVRDDKYLPARFEQDGFVHCTGDAEATLDVAKSYFSQAREPLWVLRIDTTRLQAQTRFEAPAPIPGAGERAAHRKLGRLFPHVYGPIETGAITGKAELRRNGSEFLWPDGW